MEPVFGRADSVTSAPVDHEFAQASRDAGTRRFTFIGVTTGKSAIMRVFPAWAEHLGLGDVDIFGHDLPLHAPAERYREVVQTIRADPLELGGLVTTHKIDLFTACREMFDFIDPYAALCGEVSSLSKRGGIFRAHAKDPISSGRSLDEFVADGYWASQRRGSDPVRGRRFQPCHQPAPHDRAPSRGPAQADRRGQPQPGSARVHA